MRSLTLDSVTAPRASTQTGRSARGPCPTDGPAPDATAGPALLPTQRYGPRPAAERTRPRDHDRLRDLVLRARGGESDAFGALYDHYADHVYRYVYYRVGSHTLAEDLTSETFLRALRRIGVFTWQGKDFGAWLVTIARNLVADHYKSSRHRLEICTADLVEGDGREEGPERAVLDSMTHRTLLTAVRSLRTEQQECVVLRFLQGLSVAETALIMGKNSGAVKALQYRAVRSLARLLPPDIR